MIEVGGLIIVIVAGFSAGVPVPPRWCPPPPIDADVLLGVAYASLLAFFAFIGFEDLANVVEEAEISAP